MCYLISVELSERKAFSTTSITGIKVVASCSLRMGEMLALTWDYIDITEESIESGRASIYVNKELQKVQRESLQALDGKGVIKTFPARLASRHTALVLKEPKTKISVRRVFLPKTVAEMLQERYKEIVELSKVVFHSLRHSSITYKLKLNGGDMKSVQGDSGHAQVKMVADVYSHIIDEDRRLNA